MNTVQSPISIRNNVAREVKKLDPHPTQSRAQAVATKLWKDLRSLPRRVSRERLERVLQRLAKFTKHAAYRTALMVVVAKSLNVTIKEASKALFQAVISKLPAEAGMSGSTLAYYVAMIKAGLGITAGITAAGTLKRLFKKNLGITNYNTILVPSNRSKVAIQMQS